MKVYSIDYLDTSSGASDFYYAGSTQKLNFPSGKTVNFNSLSGFFMKSKYDSDISLVENLTDDFDKIPITSFT